MSWDIPLPYVVKHPAPLQWNGWWRGVSLLVMLCVAAGCGLWYWLKDPRILLLTFCAVITVTVLFLGIAGWRLFSYGVNAEHAESMEQQNEWHQEKWQVWAQSGLNILDFSYIFPAEIPHPFEHRTLVNNEVAFSLPSRPPLLYLFEEILAPLAASLRMLRNPLDVYLPCNDDEAARRAFALTWEKLGLSLSAVSDFFSGAVTKPWADQTTQWLNDGNSNAKLLIFFQWPENDQPRIHTDGAIAWLITANGSGSVRSRCRLHRPVTGTAEEAEHNAGLFLKYQAPAMNVSDQWYNQTAIAAQNTLTLKRCRQLRVQNPASNPPVPEQQFIPYWLGKPGPATDYFTITLMMLMAEYRYAPQSLVLSQADALVFATVSPGEDIS